MAKIEVHFHQEKTSSLLLSFFCQEISLVTNLHRCVCRDSGCALRHMRIHDLLHSSEFEQSAASNVIALQ